MQQGGGGSVVQYNERERKREKYLKQSIRKNVDYPLMVPTTLTAWYGYITPPPPLRLFADLKSTGCTTHHSHLLLPTPEEALVK